MVSAKSNSTSYPLSEAECFGRHSLPVVDTPLPKRFLTKFITDPETGCWNWTGAKKIKRYKDKVYVYGSFSVDGTPYGITSASRASYEYHFGPLPDGYEADHLCLNKLCVNPSHLEAVTHRVNCARRLKSGPDPNSEVARQAALKGWQSRRSK